ncbi:unnamed protein product [Caenorhabditis sp. 36 PRJEB53466]|nr:unnamed protein product [Caenorhabditis sp. 36 PRJEB53466]
MPNTKTQYYEKLREKRRVAREHAQKIQEEKKRAREMKEEKWTTKNEFELISEHRKLQREEYISKIRKEGRAIMEMAVAKMKAYEEKEARIAKDIEEEKVNIEKFIAEQCSYYDEIHKQISPPKERSVEEIMKEIEKELKEIYEVFQSVMEFNPKMAELEGQEEEKDGFFAKEIAQLEKEYAENTLKWEDLQRKIAVEKAEYEKDSVRYAAIGQEKAMENHKLEKQIKALEAKIGFMKMDTEEAEEIEKLKERIEEETRREHEILKALKDLEETIRKSKEKKANEKARKEDQKKEDKEKEKEEANGK